METNKRHKINEGLPNGAKKFQDTATAQLLGDTWRKETEFYNQTGICPDAGLNSGRNNIPGLEEFNVEISGPRSSIFKGKLHPIAEGESWYRGVAVQVEENNPSRQVIIFSGWMQPWIAGKTQPPIAYTIGDVPDETVRSVIDSYTSHILSVIEKFENSFRRS